MRLSLVILVTVLLHYCSVNALRSSGDEFYIPFWFDDPRNSSDTTLLYLSTFEETVIEVNVSIHIQNRTRVSVFSRQTLVSQNNITVVDVEKWLPPDIGRAKDRSPQPSWWLINYIHIKTEGGKVLIHVHSRIDDKFYIYNPFPLHHYNEHTGNFTYYILQEPQQKLGKDEVPVTVVLSVINGTKISIDLTKPSNLQINLITTDDIQQYKDRQPGNRIYQVQSTSIPQVLAILPEPNNLETLRAVKVEANNPVLVFTGRGLKQRNNGFLPYQQIPPTIDWGRNFVIFPIHTNHSCDFYFELVTTEKNQNVSYEPYSQLELQKNVTHTAERIIPYADSAGYIIKNLDSGSFWYFYIRSDKKMWFMESYAGEKNFLYSVVPSVEHYANCYKFPAAGNSTSLESVEIKLVIPARYFQPEEIILDGISLQNYHNIKFLQLYSNHTVAFYIAEYLLEYSYSMDLHGSNMHLICHQNPNAKFGLLITTTCLCPHYHTIYSKAAFPAGFDGNVSYSGDPAYGKESNEGGGNTTQSDIRTKISPAIVVAVLLGIVAVMIACIFVVRSGVKKRRKTKGFAHQRLSIPMFEMREPDSANCEYDLFISFAEEDRNFVDEHLFHPLEERGFQVCWHHRDFLPGYSIIENIKNSIDRSRRVILVFSEHFHKSEYCMFELRYSCDKMLATNSQMLIPIVLNEDSFPRELDHITYWCFSAEHPEENNLQALSESLGTPIARGSQEALDQEEEALFQESNVLYML